MDDEIDIEEHDVLDHPAIKSIFPDLSIIKKEISSYEEQVLNKKCDSGVTSTSAEATIVEDSQNATLSDTGDKRSEDAINLIEENQNLTRIIDENKKYIFLNKKSQDSMAEARKKDCCTDSGDISSDDDVQVIEEIEQPPTLSYEKEKLLFHNKIILGSKPTLKSGNEENNFEQNIKPYLAKIYLDDISAYLEKSERFCSICCILFPIKENLENHAKTCHEMSSKPENQKNHTLSTLKPAIKRSIHKCVKCSQTFTTSSNMMKHMRNIHKKSRVDFKRLSHRIINQKSRLAKTTVVQKTKTFPNSKCFHCKKIFSSQKHLIEHMYKVLQSSNNSQKTKLIENMKNNKRAYMTTRKQNDNLQKKQNTESKQDTDWHYRCYYCSYYFNEKKFFINHMANKHKDKDVHTTNKVKYDPICKFCSAMCSTVYSYNVHLLRSHKDMVDKTFKIQPKLYLTKVELILAGKRGGRGKVQSDIQTNDDHQSQESVQCFPNNNINDINVSNTVLSDSLINTEDGEKLIQRKRSASLTGYRKKLKVDEDANKTNIHQESQNKIDSLVLKGILFKCKRCDINFLSNRCAMNHSDHMEFLINWKCLICLKIFKKHDELLHKQQHSFSNEFVVYELSESKLSRVLYKCPKCAIHFDDNRYAFHFMHCGKTVTESVYCNPCDILLEKTVMQSHEYEHKFNNQTLSDFTIITSDVIESTPATVTNNIIKKEINYFPEKGKSLVKSNKSLDVLNMNYCVTCKCFISYNYLRTVHKEGRCGHMHKHICKHCGLIVTMQSMKSHRNMHKLDKDLKLQNFKFYDVVTNKRILPPIPEYPKCKSCDVCFLSKAAVINHICEDIDFLTCPFCNIKLCDDTFKLHVSFHHYYFKRRNNNMFNITNRCLPNENAIIKKESKSTYSSFPSLTGTSKTKDKMYEENVPNISIHDSGRNVIETITQNQLGGSKQSNNINPVETEISTSKINSYKIILNSERKSDVELHHVVYCCSYCYMTLMTYDQAVEHCQDHYYGIDISKIIYKCTECKMKYDQRIKDHHKLHHIQASQQSYKILNFDAVYFAVDYKIWNKNLFGILEQDIKKDILNHSIYKYEGRIKLQVIQKGTTDLTVYKCSTCRMFVEPHAILGHIENSCFRQRKHICSFCGLPFVSHVFRMAHEKIHQFTPDLTVYSFNIIVFNREKDKGYNKKMINSRNHFVLYQCRKCKGLFERFQSLEHSCNIQNLKQCKRCLFLIYNSDYKSHFLKHDLLKNFIHNNMKIIRFGKSDKLNTVSSGLPFKFNGVVKDYSFYKCIKCDLHFKKSLTMPEHDCVDMNSKVTCFKCNLTILKKDINQHYKIHDKDLYFVKENFNVVPYKDSRIKCPDSPFEGHEENENVCLIKADDIEKKIFVIKEKNVISNILSVKIAKIYKCDCGQHFLDKLSINSHFGHCKLKILKQTCTKCSLLFSSKHLFTHLLKHHGDKRYSYKFCIIPMNKNKSKVIEIYNCVLCNLHFEEFQKAKEHLSNCSITPTTGSECKTCKLFFEDSSLEFHESHHHGDNIADFDIIDLKPDFDNFGNSTLDQNASNSTSQPDVVTDSNCNDSGGNVSQPSLDCYSNNIFKCIDCNLHFLTEYSFKNHINKHEASSFKQKECEQCNLNFCLPTLAKHVYVHHNQMNLELEKININSVIEDSTVCTDSL